MRFNAPISCIGDIVSRDALRGVLELATEAVRSRGVTALTPRHPKEMLVSLPGCSAQGRHADGLIGEALDTVTDTAEARLAAHRSSADGAHEVPMSAVISLSQATTLLVTPYTPEEERLLLQEPAQRRYPAKRLQMARLELPPWHMVLFGQHRVHAGDAFHEANLRMHMFWEHADCKPTSDSTWTVAALGKKVEAYYTVPPKPVSAGK